MRTFVLVMAVCAAGLVAPGAAEAHIEYCPWQGSYIEIQSGSHVHFAYCDDPQAPGSGSGGYGLERYLRGLP